MAASSVKLSKKLTSQTGSIKPKPPRKPNAIRQIMEREERRSVSVAVSAAAAAATSNSNLAVSSSRGGQCPNKNCKNPNIVDGTCQSCGRVADDSNIVSDIQFGESSTGAAIVQGTFMGADQGGVRSIGGPAFRRVAGGGSGETRERSLREAKQMMRGFSHALGGVPPAIFDKGVHYYRLAAMDNFIQGRNTREVVAICLYAACRTNPNNYIQILDVSEMLRVNMFDLARTYKKFHMRFPNTKEGAQPIIMENVVWNCAAKLEFFEKTTAVATTAVRIAHRMNRDWMTTGRRPGGIVGAALIYSSRIHGFRRSVQEVVYIAKVTAHTIQERINEFSYLPTAQFTIDDFLNQDHLQTEYDPPSFYKKTAEWQEKYGPKRSKKRKRSTDDDREGECDVEQITPQPEFHTPAPLSHQLAAVSLSSPAASPAPEPRSPKANVDADGFVIPTVPASATARELVKQRALIASADEEGDQQLAALADEYGDEPDPASGDEYGDGPDRASEEAMALKQGIDLVPGSAKKRGRGRPKGTPKKLAKEKGSVLPIDDRWLNDEMRLTEDIYAMMENPELLQSTRAVVEEHNDELEIARLHEIEEERLQALTATAGDTFPRTFPSHADTSTPASGSGTKVIPIDPRITPASQISMEPDVADDEFADDPEVQNCKLLPEEIKIKELLWANENKDWLRAQQVKIFKQKMAAKAPPKQRRNRKKKPRIGEGQTSPASTPGEAAVNALKTRAISKRINYNAYYKIFDHTGPRAPGSEFGETSTAGSGSRVSSPEESREGSPEESILEDEDIEEQE